MHCAGTENQRDALSKMNPSRAHVHDSETNSVAELGTAETAHEHNV